MWQSPTAVGDITLTEAEGPLSALRLDLERVAHLTWPPLLVRGHPAVAIGDSGGIAWSEGGTTMLLEWGTADPPATTAELIAFADSSP